MSVCHMSIYVDILILCDEINTAHGILWQTVIHSIPEFLVLVCQSVRLSMHSATTLCSLYIIQLFTIDPRHCSTADESKGSSFF